MTEFGAEIWERLTKELAESSPTDLLVKLLAAIIFVALSYIAQKAFRWLIYQMRNNAIPGWGCCRRLATAQKAVAEDGSGLWLSVRPRRMSHLDRLNNTNKLILTIANLKGGVGKTTITANLAAFFANPFAERNRPQRRVLVIDLDFQGSCSSMLFANTAWQPSGALLSDASQAISGQFAGVRGQLGQAVVDIPSARGISAFYDLARVENREMIRWLIGDEVEDIRFRLANLLTSDTVFNQFDVVLIDAPPRLTTGSVQAFCASTHVLIPTIPDPLGGEDPVGYFGQQLKAHAELWPHLKVLGVIGTMTDRRARAQEEPALKRAGDRLRFALQGAPISLKHVETRGTTLEFPYECTLRRSSPLARAAGEGIPYVALGNTQAGRAIRAMFDQIGEEVVRRWQL